jgi:hypothetical protein
VNSTYSNAVEMKVSMPDGDVSEQRRRVISLQKKNFVAPIS